jgi:hypothetical protein
MEEKHILALLSSTKEIPLQGLLAKAEKHYKRAQSAKESGKSAREIEASLQFAKHAAVLLSQGIVIPGFDVRTEAIKAYQRVAEICHSRNFYNARDRCCASAEGMIEPKREVIRQIRSPVPPKNYYQSGHYFQRQNLRGLPRLT